jgi:hypothetical protein
MFSRLNNLAFSMDHCMVLDQSGDLEESEDENNLTKSIDGNRTETV